MYKQDPNDSTKQVAKGVNYGHQMFISDGQKVQKVRVVSRETPKIPIIKRDLNLRLVFQWPVTNFSYINRFGR